MGPTRYGSRPLIYGIFGKALSLSLLLVYGIIIQGPDVQPIDLGSPVAFLAILESTPYESLTALLYL